MVHPTICIPPLIFLNNDGRAAILVSTDEPFWRVSTVGGLQETILYAAVLR